MAERRRARHAAGAVQQEQRGGRARDLPRPPGNAAAPRAISPRGASTGRPRAANLAALAEELDLGLDSFILVDDNPKEVHRSAGRRAGGAGAAAARRRPKRFPDFLRHVWAFDRARVTEEDRRRGELYAQRAERARAARSVAASLEEFLASLELEVEIAPMEPAQVARVAQFTQRTNQMNATGPARREAEIRALLPTECLTVHVTDRFGDYGLTGVMIFRAAARALRGGHVPAELPRAGPRRGASHGGAAGRDRPGTRPGRGGDSVRGRRSATGRRLLFLESLGAPAVDGVFRFERERTPPAVTLPAVRGAACRRCAGPRSAAAGDLRVRPHRLRAHRHGAAHSGSVLERIRLRATGRRRTALARRRRRRAPPLERDLAELWAELLNVPAVGIHDNFFELGGHSLLAVQLLSRVRQIYGVELSLEVVYSGEFTVAELAKAMELKEIEQAGGDYQDLLAELEGLSDERCARLLAEEQDASLPNAHSADRQRLLRAAARRRDAQQPASGWTSLARAGPRVPHRLRRPRAKAPSCALHASIAVFAVDDPARRVQVLRQQIREFQPGLGAGLVRRPGPRAAAGGAPFGPRPRGLPGAHAAVLPLRPGELESGSRRRGPGGAMPPGSWPSAHHMAEYIARALGREAAVIHPPIYGAGPFPDLRQLRRAGWSP